MKFKILRARRVYSAGWNQLHLVIEDEDGRKEDEYFALDYERIGNGLFERGPEYFAHCATNMIRRLEDRQRWDETPQEPIKPGVLEVLREKGYDVE